MDHKGGSTLPYRAAIFCWLQLYMIPLSANRICGLETSTIFLAACWMTTRIFYHYAEFMKIQSPATNLLLGRNLPFAALWSLMLSRRQGEKQVLSKPILETA